MIDEYLKCFSSTKRKARTSHICCECLGVIEPGEVYISITGLGSDGWEVYNHCLACAELFDSVCGRYEYDERPAFGQLWDYFMEETNFTEHKKMEYKTQRDEYARFLRNKRRMQRARRYAIARFCV